MAVVAPVGATTTTNVTIANFAFSPSQVAIAVNDSVQWTWGSDPAPHSTTSTATPALWDSGLRSGNGTTFTHTFAAAGSFPYICTLHTFMTGAVTVRSANVPPTIAITAPTDGSTFAAPWTGTIRASDSDSDGTVARVDFYAGGTLLGTVLNPAATASLGVTNLAAGTYALRAVATDNLGATNSATITIHVVTSSPILLSAPARLSGTNFQFTYSTTPGLRYAIHRGNNLSTLTPIATNTALGSSTNFTDRAATGSQNFYAISLLPNP
jgi:plastocyanin